MTNQEAFAQNLRVYARRAGVEFTKTPEEIFGILAGKGGYDMGSRKTAMYPVIRQALMGKVTQVHVSAVVGMHVLYRAYYPSPTDTSFNIHDYGNAVAWKLECREEWEEVSSQVGELVLGMIAVRNREKAAPPSVGKMIAQAIINKHMGKRITGDDNSPDSYM